MGGWFTRQEGITPKIKQTAEAISRLLQEQSITIEESKLWDLLYWISLHEPALPLTGPYQVSSWRKIGNKIIEKASEGKTDALKNLATWKDIMIALNMHYRKANAPGRVDSPLPHSFPLNPPPSTPAPPLTEWCGRGMHVGQGPTQAWGVTVRAWQQGRMLASWQRPWLQLRPCRTEQRAVLLEPGAVIEQRLPLDRYRATVTRRLHSQRAEGEWQQRHRHVAPAVRQK
ncbi:uncharacterized protein LOC113947449 [Corapipo altera]|uniref:uncharacterized protein LOC113947449 n=1 Tax=Corapipo altera TaxID=415028 RepID=UPI000FD6671C|nr:uncharacterized protein LOC113947449 [Corapipo altera]